LSYLTSPCYIPKGDILRHDTSKELESPPAYDQVDLPIRLLTVKQPSIYFEETIYRKEIYVQLHTPPPYRIEHFKGVYQEDNLLVYTKEKTLHLFAYIKFGYCKSRFLLNGIGP
jgi:hypothetical protein